MYIINLNPKQSERRAVSHLTGLSETDFLPNFILSNGVKKYQQEIWKKRNFNKFQFNNS